MPWTSFLTHLVQRLKPHQILVILVFVLPGGLALAILGVRLVNSHVFMAPAAWQRTTTSHSSKYIGCDRKGQE